MTPQPQKEYIITDEMITAAENECIHADTPDPCPRDCPFLEEWGEDGGSMRDCNFDTSDYLRSRPAPSLETITKELALELCMDARKEAAAQAREKVLEALGHILDDDTLNRRNDEDRNMIRKSVIRSWIEESLRSEVQE